MRYCHFCGRPEENSSMMMDGNGIYICGECLELGHKFINEYKEEAFTKNIKDVPKPKEIKEFLDKYVIGQEAAKEKISVAVYNHYKRISAENINDDVEIEKSNCLLVGPTGSGKTYIARTIAKMLDVPFTIVDATALTQAGYVGEDVESCVSRLLQAADYNIERCERGIIFIDEIDKIAKVGGINPSLSRDVSGEGVQQGLLKILEGSIVMVPPAGGRKNPEQKLIAIDTKNILFICGGAFNGLDKKIESRFNVHAIGFDTQNPDKKKIENENPLKYVSTQDLKSFGLIPEFIGRLPVITYMDELDKESLKRILIEPKNALIKQYEKLFALDGIKIKFNKDVYDYVVDKAIESKIGARGLRSIMEELMTKLMFDLPSSDKKSYTVNLKYAKSILEK